MTGLIPAAIATSFLAPYSDQTGRRRSFLLPVSGALLRAGVCLAVAALDLPFQTLVIGSVLEGFSGKIKTFQRNKHFLRETQANTQRRQSESLQIYNSLPLSK